MCMREAWWQVVLDAQFGSAWGGWCSIDPPWVAQGGALEEYSEGVEIVF
jgi:hypothetical protein